MLELAIEKLEENTVYFRIKRQDKEDYEKCNPSPFRIKMRGQTYFIISQKHPCYQEGLNTFYIRGTNFIKDDQLMSCTVGGYLKLFELLEMYNSTCN